MTFSVTIACSDDRAAADTFVSAFNDGNFEDSSRLPNGVCLQNILGEGRIRCYYSDRKMTHKAVITLDAAMAITKATLWEKVK